MLAELQCGENKDVGTGMLETVGDNLLSFLIQSANVQLNYINIGPIQRAVFSGLKNSHLTERNLHLKLTPGGRPSAAVVEPHIVNFDSA